MGQRVLLAVADRNKWGLIVRAALVLGAFGSGLLIWENLETENDEARHMKNVPKEKVLELWRKLAQGKIDEINEEAWLPGDVS